MKTIFGIMLLAGLAGCAQHPGVVDSMPGVNIDFSKNRVRAYHQNGMYRADVAATALAARKYLDQRLKEGVTKPAIVFDIDETLLSNYGYDDKQVDFGYIPDLQHQWEAKAAAPAIEPTRDLFLHARKKGVPIFLITGRSEPQRAATDKNLKAMGLSGYERLYLKPPQSTSTADFKTGRRREIADQGYNIVVNMGDQMSDLEGGYSERAFKLPNHFYFIP